MFCRRRLGPSQNSMGTIVASHDDAGNIRVFYGVDRPVISVQTLEYGYRGSASVVIENPDFRIDGDYQLFPNAVDPQYRPAPTGNNFVAHVNYISGWCTTALANAGREGERSLAVEDTTWLVPGRQYQLRRIDFGKDQTVTISPMWIPPAPTGSPVPGTVPTVERLWYPHAVGSALTDLPVPVYQGVINYALALMRAYATVQAFEDGDPYPDTPLNADTRYVDPREVAPTLVADAERLLEPYRDR